MLNTTRNEEEISRVRSWAEERIIEEKSSYSGMIYEEGVRDVIAWIQGDMDESPDYEDLEDNHED